VRSFSDHGPKGQRLSLDQSDAICSCIDETLDRFSDKLLIYARPRIGLSGRSIASSAVEGDNKATKQRLGNVGGIAKLGGALLGKEADQHRRKEKDRLNHLTRVLKDDELKLGASISAEACRLTLSGAPPTTRWSHTISQEGSLRFRVAFHGKPQRKSSSFTRPWLDADQFPVSARLGVEDAVVEIQLDDEGEPEPTASQRYRMQSRPSHSVTAVHRSKAVS
jgi:hypothetical protein